jgi:hypothetical protein
VLVWKNLGGVCFPAIACCLRFGSPPADGSCLVRSDMIATGFPRYKSRHGRGTDFDHHGLGAATLATECVAVNQMSPLELVQMSLATIPDAMLYNLADHSSGIVPGNRTSHLALPPPDRPRQSEPVERTSGGNSLPGTYYTGEQRAFKSSPASERRESNAAKGGTPRK